MKYSFAKELITRLANAYVRFASGHRRVWGLRGSLEHL